jgi:hypothetical protein
MSQLEIGKKYNFPMIKNANRHDLKRFQAIAEHYGRLTNAETLTFLLDSAEICKEFVELFLNPEISIPKAIRNDLKEKITTTMQTLNKFMEKRTK